MPTPVLCLDFDFAGRGPARLTAGGKAGVLTLRRDGAWHGAGDAVLEAGGDPFGALSRWRGREGEVLVGWLAYEAGSFVEPRVPLRRRQPVLGEAVAVRPVWGPPGPGEASRRFAVGAARWNLGRERFMAQVAATRKGIALGDFFQVNLSMMSRRAFEGDPLALYETLRATNPGPFNGYFAAGDSVLISNSPELLVAVEGGAVWSKPIAGTVPTAEATGRGAERQFRRDVKEQAEHVMLVDLMRNDLGRVARYGSVKVTELLGVEHYSHVAHLVSTVGATLRPGLSPFDVLRAVVPGGTITGTPKVAAMEHIRRTESHVRGPYTGTLFVFEPPDRLTANLMIRTAHLRVRERLGGGAVRGVLDIGAGAGIVADSDPGREWRECRAKLEQFAALQQ